LVFQGNIKSLPLPTILKDYLSPLPSSLWSSTDIIFLVYVYIVK
jgi:hypothetical protein